MSLNKFMHPRNYYKDKKPDFEKLASKYPEFSEHIVVELNGKITLDFKKPESVQILTKTLLREDFGIAVDLPEDRLTPTLPSRLNYIHWIEDIFIESKGTHKSLRGIDIGTGASCIYPLLGCKLNEWSFLATELDEKNVEYAQANVQLNNMEDKIKVMKVKKDHEILEQILSENKENFDFVMCNPPFFADHMEIHGMPSTSSKKHINPASVSTAADCESIVHGGEVAFIKQIIQESLKFKNNVSIFTSMVGKKINMSVIKEELKERQLNFSTYEFCQGKTMRWGVAWSFNSSMKFPRSYFKKKKKTSPLIFEIPFDNGLAIYDIQNITTYVISQLKELKIQFKEGKRTETHSSITMTARQNTWSNQRRKRRLEKKGKMIDSFEKTHFSEADVMNQSNTPNKQNGVVSNSDDLEPESKKMKFEENVCQHSLGKTQASVISTINKESDRNEEIQPTNSEHSSPHSESINSDYLVKCRIQLKKTENTITLELIDLIGDKRDVVNQILQYFKNKLISKSCKI